MSDSSSVQLRFGPYSFPKGFRIGDVVHCEYKKLDVEIHGMSNSPIQWFTTGHGRRSGPIVFGDLVRAVQTESETAVATNWGVDKSTVWRWRKALGVTRMTPGTIGVFRELFESRISIEDAERGRKRSRSKKSRAKIAASKAGKPMHDNTRKALLAAAKKPKSQSHREAMSKAHRARGTRPPQNGRFWTEAEDRRLGTASDRELAKELGRSVESVRKRRLRLKGSRLPNKE